MTGVRNASSTVAKAGGGEALAGGSAGVGVGVPVGFAHVAGGPWELARATVTCVFPFKLFWTLSIPHSGHWGAAHAAGANGRRTSLLSIPRSKKG